MSSCRAAQLSDLVPCRVKTCDPRAQGVVALQSVACAHSTKLGHQDSQ